MNYLNQLKKNAEDYGVSMVLIMVDAEGDPCSPEAKMRKQYAINHRKWIDVAHYLGCHTMRTNCRGIEDATDEENLEKLLADLDGIPEAQRSARFQCLMVFMRHANDPTPLICQGTWEGRILLAASGDNGFGYDPVFFVPTHNCSSAELPADVKNTLSHRGQALRQLVKALQQYR